MQEFNYHSHTYRCGHADLDMKDEDYIQDYIKMGFKRMAFTDHCPEKNEIDKRNNMRMKYSQRKEYLETIQALKEKYAGQIEIQSGYEIEYLPGEEQNLKELKEETDKLILGQHFVYDDNQKLKIHGKDEFSDKELLRYAEYIEQAMKLNLPDIIAHPDFYMLKRKDFGEIEAKVAHHICKAAETYGVPLEMNLNHIFKYTYYENTKLNSKPIEEQRKNLDKVAYPCKEFWKIASQYDIHVLYGIDAHHRGQILVFNELVELANEVIGKDIIKQLNFIDLK